MPPRTSRLLTMGALFALLCQFPIFSKDFLLVQDAAPRATIVTAAQPSENARAAALELQRYVRKISSAELAIIDDTQSPTGPLILVGPSRFTEQISGLAIPNGLTPQLREEGFVIVCRGDRLVLAGNDAGPYYGTRYAVAELLHRLGVRWFMPGEFGEVLPQTKTLALPEMDISQRPAFPMRNYWEHHRGKMEADATEWKIHHKMNPQMHKWFGVPSDSSIRDYLPGKEVFKAHPEWFALRHDGGRDPNMVCMTSIGEVFDGIITGAAPKGTYVRLLKFPAEGRVVRRVEGIDVGDKVRVRLLNVDVPKGFIDFERL